MDKELIDDSEDIEWLKARRTTIHFFPNSGGYTVTLLMDGLFAIHAFTLADAIRQARNQWEQLTRPQ